MLTACTYLGYVVFRDAIAEEIGIPGDELDTRARSTFNAVLSALGGASPRDRS